jgi:Cu(I)/Ag(I) efflux system membrane fusion protein
MATADELRKAMQEEAEARVKLSSAESRLAQANDDYQATRVRAPVSGIVTACDLNPGTVVRQGTDLMKISEINPVLVNAMMGEEKTNYVYIGQEAEITFYAFPGRKFQGEVVIVNPSIDEKSRLVTAIIRVKNPKFEIKPGMNGMAQLQYRREALRVPGIALLSQKDSAAHVFAVDDQGVAHLRQLRLGASSEGYFEVIEGLERGDRVVVVGQSALSDKVRVRVGDQHAAHL